MSLNYNETATIFKALCDENRIMILEQLQSGDKHACELLENLNIAQSTLSHHMKTLTESGLVKSSRCGKWMHYSLDNKGIVRAKELLETVTKHDD